MRREETMAAARRGRGGGATSYPKAPGAPPERRRKATRPGAASRRESRREASRARRWAVPVVALGLAAGCTTTPVTGSRAFNLFPVAQDAALGEEAYHQILAETEADPVTAGPKERMVERVMHRLVAAVDEDMGFEWEVTLLDADDTVNAFALPGGKMAVYTGILPVAQDEEGLAVVMGHEIAHVVARHGTQRMTQAMGVEAVFAFLDVGDYEGLARQLVDLTVGLPFSRAHESEADHIGLVYMARAGYDPRAAVGFWSRMAEASGGAPPEFLSTHPSHETRIEHLQELMPEALEIYRSSGGGAATP